MMVKSTSLITLDEPTLCECCGVLFAICAVGVCAVVAQAERLLAQQEADVPIGSDWLRVQSAWHAYPQFFRQTGVVQSALQG